MRTFTQSISGSQNAEFGGGNFFMLIETGTVCNVEFFRNGSSISKALDVDAGYKAEFNQPFTRVDVNSTSQQTVKVGISAEGRGSYDPPGTVSIVQGNAIADTSKTVGATEVEVAPLNNSRKGLRFKAHADNTGSISLGNTGLNHKATIIELIPGDIWLETEGAAASWYARSDLSNQTIYVQEIS